MFFSNFKKDNLDEVIESNEKRIRELSIQIENLDKKIEDLYKELKLTPEQVNVFIENRSYHSDQAWEAIQKERQAINEKLRKELSNIIDPLKQKQKYSQMSVQQQHWLYVR